MITVDSVKAELKKLIPVLRESRAAQISEGDTCVRIQSILTRVLGYDAFHDVAREYPVQAHRVDFAIKIGGTVRFFIEAKPMSIKLKDTHVYQGANYAATEGIPWCVVTNGHQWRVYRINTQPGGVDHTLVFDVNLIDGALDEVADHLYLMTARALERKLLDQFYEQQSKLSPANVLCAILDESVLRSARRQIKESMKIVISNDGLARAIKSLCRPEIVESADEIRFAEAVRTERKARRARGATKNINTEAESETAV